MKKEDGPEDLMGYEALQREALRGVVRLALKRTAELGLPGEHQLYITFKTKAQGVSGPREVMAQYPDEMTIALRPDQFRNLAPGETYFSVTLAFGGQPRDLSIPYSAVTRFEDPAVQYGLRFPEPPDAPPAAPDQPADATDTPKIVSLDQFRKK
jgi:hypothetical protein